MYQATGFEIILNHQLWHRICQLKAHSFTDQLGFFFHYYQAGIYRF